ncbi:MAG: SGNH/GDSL hydrolase family protein [Verrucomicrobiales bacterium]|nr:SGNH/GDSL hydrolase family protein [Verrucomicrobiales bacterium]
MSATNTKKTILCFGDSNTWGFVPGSDGERYGPDIRWPGVMGNVLGDEFSVIEEAQNGRMSVWEDPYEPTVSKCGLNHLPVVLESQKPLDLAIIMLGTNDLKNHMNHNAYAIAHGVTTLVDVVLASDAGPENNPPLVLMICPAPVSDWNCPFWHLFDTAPEISRKLPAAYKEMAADRGVEFLNAGDFASCPDPDCIHIDSAGHASLGRAIANKVREMFG